MEKEHHSNSHLLFIAFFIAGFLMGFYIDIRKDLHVDTHCEALEEKHEELKEHLDSEGFLPSLQMLSVSGTVKSVNGNVILLQSSGPVSPSEDLPSQREVTVTDSTRIVMIVQKSAEEYQKESESSGSKQAVPVPFTEKSIKLEDIKANDFVTIDAASDIKMSSKFDAVKITVQGQVTSVPAATGDSVPPPPPSAADTSSTPPPPPPVAQDNSGATPAPPPR